MKTLSSVRFRERTGKALFVLVLAFAAAILPARAQTLLSYWDFNNTSSVYSSGTLGSFSTTAASFGEAYNSTLLRLSGNTANGVVYGSSYIDFSGMGGTANGGNTTSQSWGVYSDSAGTNLYSGDTATQKGSLLMQFKTGASSATESLVFALDTAGYQGISLSFAGRIGGAGLGALSWSYSSDDSTWTTFSPTTTGASGASVFAATTLSLGTAFDNQNAVYLRLTLTEAQNNTGGLALDNVQLLATALAVPEPSVWLLSVAGLAGLAVLRRNRSPEASRRAS